jgi:galactoside O-acetyltransferase
MVAYIRKKISNYLLSRHLSVVKKYMHIGNSHFLNNFRMAIVGASDRKYVYVGDDCMLDCNILFESPAGEVLIGNRTYIGESKIICRSKIEFEDNVFVAGGTCFYDHNSHSIDFREREKDITQQLKDYRAGGVFIENKNWDVVAASPIKVCSHAWVGMNCLILKGVVIGEGAIVGAGSVVTKSVEPWTVVGGNPAKILKEIPQELRRH